MTRSERVANTVEAVRRTLVEHPEGCRESALWHGVEAAGVDRAVFDEAVRALVETRWAERRGNRLRATAATTR